MEEETHRNQNRHNLVLCEMLAKEAYPPILRHFGIPEDHHPLQITMHCMQLMHEDLEATYLWLETELLMKNSWKIQEAYKSLLVHYAQNEGEVPTIEEILYNIR